MCGILGGNKAGWNYEKALESINHRGPDASRIEQYSNFKLGFCRLAIRDLSASAMQPMSDASDKVHLVFNGEIYGFDSLKKELQEDYLFRTTSDTEVILYAYLKYGEEFIDKIDGIFSMAIYDERIERILLYRDRVGVKPLYYYQRDDRFAFASEMKGIEKLINDENLEVDYTAVYDYLYFMYIPDPKSVYKNVYKLPPATKLVFDAKENRVIKKEKYWLLKANPYAERTKSEDEISDTLRSLIQKSVKEQLVSDVPVGTFLSGGIDSSIITYEANKVKTDIHAFSMGFQEKEYDESKIAERFCKENGFILNKKILEINDIGKVRKRLRGWYDEPYADTSAFPTYCVSEFAKKEVTVVLTGDGGDELFGGYPRYTNYRAWMNRVHDYSGKERRDYELLGVRRQNCICNEDGYKKYAKAFGIEDDYNPYQFIDQYNIEDLPPITRMRYIDFHTYLPCDILTKVDRVSMSVSLEARVPFLSREIIEYAFSLSEEECNKGDVLKYALKKAYDGIIPDEILYGRKRGFSIPTNYLWREQKAESIYAGILKEHWGELLGGAVDFSYDVNNINDRLIKFQAFTRLYSAWKSLAERGTSVAEILKNKGYKKVAIYGMGDMGRHLYNELKNTGINVCYGIDKSIYGEYAGLEIVKPDDDLKPVDAIIITNVVDTEDVIKKVKDIVDCAVLLFEDIVYEM